MSIVSVEEFKAYYRSELQGDDVLYQSALDAADSAIQETCQRKFAVAGSASARTFAPRALSNVLRIHDCTTVTSVVENGTTLTVNTDHITEPVQTVSWTGETTPITQLRRLSGNWYTDRGLGTVVVTATWGWAAIPAAIKEACRILAKDIAKNRSASFGIAAITDFGPTAIRENRQVGMLIAPYRRVEGFGVA